MAALSVDPPHLMIAVYSDRAEAETFARMCDVVLGFGCVPLDSVEVAPVDRDFELLSDLGGARETLTTTPDRRARLVASEEAGLRVVRAGYSHRKFGTVLVEYIQRVGGGAHPIGVALSSDALGIPGTLWSGSRRRAAYSIADWSRAVLEAAASKCDPLYGAIGVEFSLPTPHQLTGGKPRLTTELFVSRRLLNRDPSLESKLRRAFSDGAATEWDNGSFFSAWAPFNARRATVDNPSATVEAAAKALGRALAVT